MYVLKNIRRIVACVLFTVLVLAGISGVETLLNEKDVSRVRVSRMLPPNSVDVAFVGSSKVLAGIVPQYLMDNYGIAAVNAASPSELFSRSLMQMKTLLRTQKPQVILCEVMGASTPYSFSETLNAFADEQLVRNATYYIDTLRVPRSLSWLDPLKYAHMLKLWVQEPFGLDYASTLSLRHENVLSLTENAYAAALGKDRIADGFNMFSMYGRVGNMKTRSVTPQELEAVQLHEKNRQVMDEMLQMSRKHGFELVFIMLPQFWNEAELKALAQLEELAVENGARFVHADELCEETGLELPNAMADLTHLNAESALVVTDWFGSYLTQHFDLPDRTQDDDPAYDRWKQHAFSYEARMAADGLKTNVELDVYVDALTRLDDSYLVVMGTNGHDVLVDEEVYNTLPLEMLPLENAPYFADELQSALAVWRGETILHDAVYEDEYALDLNVDGTSVVISQGMEKVPALHIDIAAHPTDLTLYSGLRFVVYDLLDRQVVDNVCFDLRYSNPQAIR